MEERTCIAIDLKSFYASVECIERGLDPMRTNLVVADESRTEKTICLAVSPSLKAYGISGRARLFEVIEQVKAANALRRMQAPGRKFTGESHDADALAKDPSLAISYIVAPPRMAHYIEHSTRIYDVYMRHISPEDIHVYSIDEILADISAYLRPGGRSARDFTREILRDVWKSTGVTATAGIGGNLYLAKVAMDIVAKHVEPDAEGARIAELDELGYRRQLWAHRPLTDFWRVGRGYASKLEAHGLYTMGDIARCSLGKPGDYHNEDLLYKLFGVNAELLIDHAWGYESCTIEQVKAYRPQSKSIVSGQVLQSPYSYEKARLVLREMADQMALDLVQKGLVTDQLTLSVGYDIENLRDPARRYAGPVATDHYGRKVPRHAHGSTNIGEYTSSAKRIMEAATALYERIVDKTLLVRRMSLCANRLLPEAELQLSPRAEQLDLFTDYAALDAQRQAQAETEAKERRVQEALLDIKERYGKNAILKGMNLQQGATARERNSLIGGHRE